MANLSYISPKAKVRESAIEGRGLFAIAPIQRNEIVCVKGGHIFDKKTLNEIQGTLGPAEIQIGENLFIGPLTSGIYFLVPGGQGSEQFG